MVFPNDKMVPTAIFKESLEKIEREIQEIVLNKVNPSSQLALRLNRGNELVQDYDLEAVGTRMVFPTERFGKIWTGFDINRLEQIGAPCNDSMRIINNASRLHQ